MKWLGVSAAATSLAACVAPQAPASGDAAPAQATIEIGWARHGADADLTTEDALAGFFAERNPGVTIKPLVLPWEDYNAKIPVMVAGGSAPDTFGCHPALLTDTYNSNGLIPIGDFIDANADTIDYDDVLYHGDAEYDGQIVGLPQKSCTHQVMFNKQIFEEAGLQNPNELYWEKGVDGWNWNTFVEMGQTLTKDLDGDGQTDQYFYAGQSSTSIVSYIRSNGGELFNEDYTACTLTEEAAVAAFQWMADLVLTYKLQPPPEMQATELGINFETGRIAVANATTCDSVRALREGFELPFAWDFVLMPTRS
jgi:multiple sugar transport system substrate-binding protein